MQSLFAKGVESVISRYSSECTAFMSGEKYRIIVLTASEDSFPLNG